MEHNDKLYLVVLALIGLVAVVALTVLALSAAAPAAQSGDAMFPVKTTPKPIFYQDVGDGASGGSMGGGCDWSGAVSCIRSGRDGATCLAIFGC